MNITEIKRRITGGQNAAQLRHGPAYLSLNEHDGLMWASNRYWITPAARVAPILEQYNLDPGKPATFVVNSTVRKESDHAPDISRFIDYPDDYPEPVTPVMVGGYEAHVRASDRAPWLAVYQTADGTLMRLPADDLAWLSDTGSDGQDAMNAALMLKPDEYFGAVRIRAKSGNRGVRAVLITADVIRRIKPSGYDTDPDTGKAAYHPAETENTGPRTIGVLMPVRLGS